MLKGKEKQPDTKEEIIDQRRAQFTFLEFNHKIEKDKKVFIGKSRKRLSKEGTDSFFEAQHKSRKGRKICHRKKQQLWA